MYRKKIVYSIITLLIFCLSIQESGAQQVTIGNNLLYDAWLTPNLRLGLRLSPHWSMGVTGGYRPWPTDDTTTRKWRHMLVSPDLRYWTDSVNVHHFFGLNLIYIHYNVGDIRFPFGLYKSVRDERRQGDLGALGAFYGYSWPLGRHWHIEALIGAAVGYTQYDRYECRHCGTKLGTERKVFLMPQAALSLVYDLPGRPRPAEPEVVEAAIVSQPLQQQPQQPATAAVAEQEPFCPAISPVPDFTGRAGQLQKDNPVLQHISQYRPYDRSRILRKEKGALYVHFPVGKSILRDDFRDNAATLDRIVDITRQIMADSTSSVQKIQIVGLASIEGNIASNERLAKARAEALKQYVQQRVQTPDSLYEAVGGGEAWAEFRDYLADHNLREAIAVIDNEPDLNRREQRLRKLNGGLTWQYIREHILQDQRNSGYVRIFFDYVPDHAAATINRASELLADGHYDEALAMLNTVRHDERAQNALGVALWQTGRHDEAISCFRRAAAQGNADAQENLRQLGQPLP